MINASAISLERKQFYWLRYNTGYFHRKYHDKTAIAIPKI